ncbi:MAG: SDR family oxidoreductase [Aridibacter famidurans]|nr:SDR family oxidoreductase [Aridibacter famidurans]
MSGLKVLVLGAGGMLGHKLVQQLPRHGVETWAAVRGNIDLSRYGFAAEDRVIGSVEATAPESVRKAVELVGPDAIVNAIGVIKQREEAKHAAHTIEINALFPHRLYGICRDAGARLVHISTDCVFAGSRGSYREEDLTDARDLYGRSKALGEVVSEGAITLRTSIIGRELGSSHGLLEWFISNGGGTVRGFTNAFFSGFTTEALADIIAGRILLNPDLEGLYHVASERISKFDLLSLINERLDLGITIEPDEDLAIDRSLDASKFERETGFRTPGWTEMIESLAEDPSPYKEWRSLTT